MFCLVSTISTAFEHQRKVEYRFLDTFGNPCNESLSILRIQQQEQEFYLHQLYPIEQQGEQSAAEYIGFGDEHFERSSATFHFDVSSQTPQKDIVDSTAETPIKTINNPSRNSTKPKMDDNPGVSSGIFEAVLHSPIWLKDQQQLSLRSIEEHQDDDDHQKQQNTLNLDEVIRESCQNVSGFRAKSDTFCLAPDLLLSFMSLVLSCSYQVFPSTRFSPNILIFISCGVISYPVE